MSFKEDLVLISSINREDDTFHITTGALTDDLVISIKTSSLINKPILVRRASDFQIISGFRRVAAFQSLGLAKIRTRIADADTEKLECVRIAITENSLQRPLNLIELSRSFYMLSEFYKNDNEMARAASELGLPDNPSFINKIKNLCKLPQPVQKGVLSNTISLAVALELEMFERDEGVAFANLFNDLKLSLNKQREVINRIKEIAIREDVSVLSLLETGRIREIVKNKDMDRALKVNKIRLYLRQRRFPEISKAEEYFEKKIKELKLGSDIKLSPPKNFEAPDYSLNLQFASMEQLREKKTALEKIIQNPILKDILV